MKQSEPTMICSTCKGAGTTPLPPVLRNTLKAFRNPRGVSKTAFDLWKTAHRIGTVNAVNNRLETLRRMGYLTRKRDGKSWHYRATDLERVSVKKKGNGSSESGDETINRGASIGEK